MSMKTGTTKPVSLKLYSICDLYFYFYRQTTAIDQLLEIELCGITNFKNSTVRNRENLRYYDKLQPEAFNSVYDFRIDDCSSFSLTAINWLYRENLYFLERIIFFYMHTTPVHGTDMLISLRRNGQLTGFLANLKNSMFRLDASRLRSGVQTRDP